MLPSWELEGPEFKERMLVCLSESIGTNVQLLVACQENVLDVDAGSRHRH